MGGGRSGLTIAVVLLIALSVPGVVGSEAGAPSHDESPGAAPSPTSRTAGVSDQCPSGSPDPPADRVGWEGGCWANETLPITPQNRLNRSEARVLVARTQARLETLRGREFEQHVTIKIVERSRIVDNRSATVPSAKRTRTNLRYEALFIVNESTDAVRDPATRYAAYYAPRKHTVVLVSDSNRTVETNEFLLAHELTHALQHEHGNPPGDGPRRQWDGRTAKAALVEGVANYLTQSYKHRCQGSWNGTCFPPEDWNPDAERTPGDWCGATDPPFNIARAHLGGFVYSDGPVFVDRLVDRGGWAAVEAAYDAPPVSTEQVIHPAKYPDDTPTDVILRDRSRAEWAPVPSAGDGPVAVELGEASLYVMFWNQWFLTDHRTAIIPCRQTYRTTHPRDGHNYSHPITAGWDGDRLVPYGNRAANESGYVWKIAWDTNADAEEFVAAYRRLLQGHGATRLENSSIYRVPASSGYTDAFALQVRSNTVIVTNAPTVADLAEIRPSLSPSPATSPTGVGTGFGVLAAVVGIVVAVAALRWRRRSSR